jgi:hypothetical protein
MNGLWEGNKHVSVSHYPGGHWIGSNYGIASIKKGCGEVAVEGVWSTDVKNV